MTAEKKEILDIVFEALKKEIKREPISSERVCALAELIRALETVR